MPDPTPRQLIALAILVFGFIALIGIVAVVEILASGGGH